jgi:signal peptidase II
MTGDQPAQPADPIDDTNEISGERSGQIVGPSAAESAVDAAPLPALSDTLQASMPVEPASSSSSPRSGDRRGLVAILCVAAAVLAGDQLTKRLAVTHLSDMEPRHVIWTLQWHLTHNSGMAFSRGTGIGPIVGAFALVVVVFLLVSLRRQGSRVGKVAVGLVVGGAVGNIADRLFRGRGWLRGSVIDFIDFQWWPIFNVADTAINVGGALLVIAALRQSVRAKRAQA